MDREEQRNKSLNVEANEANRNNQDNDREYYVNLDGETVKVDVKNDSEYACLLNCLEGYYLYGGDDEDENPDEEDYNEDDDDEEDPESEDLLEY